MVLSLAVRIFAIIINVRWCVCWMMALTRIAPVDAGFAERTTIGYSRWWVCTLFDDPLLLVTIIAAPISNASSTINYLNIRAYIVCGTEITIRRVPAKHQWTWYCALALIIPWEVLTIRTPVPPCSQQILPRRAASRVSKAAVQKQIYIQLLFV